METNGLQGKSSSPKEISLLKIIVAHKVKLFWVTIIFTSVKNFVSICKVFGSVLYVTLLLLFSGFASAQNGGAISYKAMQDSISVYQKINISKSKYWVDRYFEKARKDNNVKEERNAWEYAIGLTFFEKKISKAARQVEDYFSWAKASGDKEIIAGAYLLRGKSKMAETDLKASLDNLYKCLELAKTIEGSDLKEYALSTISSILQITGDDVKANEIRHEMLAYFTDKKIDSSYTKELKSSRIIYVNASLAISYRKRNLMDSAAICEENMKKHLKFVDKCTQSVYYLSKAERAYDEKRFADARSLFKKSHDMCPAEYPLTQLNYDYQIGKSELGLKNYQEAIRILQSGIDSYKVLPEEEGYMDDYYKLLANAYKETGQLEKANFYFEKYIVSSSEFSKLKSAASQAFREKEMKEFNLELRLLENEKKEQKNLLQLILILGTLLVLLLLALLLNFYRIRKRNELRFQKLLAKLNNAQNQKKIIDSKDQELEENTSTEVSSEITNQILEGLRELERKNFFLNPDCSSYNVAKKIKTNTSYLSKVINQEFQKNFNTYINDLRINYAMVQLKEDRRFRSFSIQSIAEELGYKSADSFTKYFKLHTGLNPSFYIKQLNSL